MNFNTPAELLKAAAEKIQEYGYSWSAYVTGKALCMNGALASAMGVAHENIEHACGSMMFRAEIMEKHIGEDGVDLLRLTQRVLAGHILETGIGNHNNSDIHIICSLNNQDGMNAEKAAAIMVAAATNSALADA